MALAWVDDHDGENSVREGWGLAILIKGLDKFRGLDSSAEVFPLIHALKLGLPLRMGGL